MRQRKKLRMKSGKRRRKKRNGRIRQRKGKSNILKTFTPKTFLLLDYCGIVQIE